MNVTFLLAEAEHAAAESSGGIGGLFTALGLDVRALVLNAVAFLVVVWVLGKFVYPHLIKALDAKRDELDAAAKHEREARASLEKAEAKAEGLLKEARKSADEIISAAHADATEQLDTARTKAAEQSERIVAEAREQLSRDVLAARQELKAEAAKLVAVAAGAVLSEKLSNGGDDELIKRSLESK